MFETTGKWSVQQTKNRANYLACTTETSAGNIRRFKFAEIFSVQKLREKDFLTEGQFFFGQKSTISQKYQPKIKIPSKNLTFVCGLSDFYQLQNIPQRFGTCYMDNDPHHVFVLVEVEHKHFLYLIDECCLST